MSARRLTVEQAIALRERLSELAARADARVRRRRLARACRFTVVSAPCFARCALCGRLFGGELGWRVDDGETRQLACRVCVFPATLLEVPS